MNAERRADPLARRASRFQDVQRRFLDGEIPFRRIMIAANQDLEPGHAAQLLGNLMEPLRRKP